jgi:thiamine biosynthesis lipoprotein
MKCFKILPLLLCCALLGACAKAAPQPYESYVYAMDTIMTVRVWSTDAAAAQKALSAVSGMISALDERFSVTGAESEIAALNAGSDAPFTLSDEGAEILARTLDISRDTGGILDPSIYPVVRAWGFTTDSYRIPDRAELQTLLQKVDFTKIALEGNAVTLESGMQIDLGSVVKGYVGDEAARLLKEQGITSAVLNLGGNVRLVGGRTDGTPFRVGVQDPLDESAYLGIVSAADKSVVTSGGYNRFFEKDGQIYWHIIDPRTGYPADSGVISATVIGNDGLRCDGLSTACFILGVEGAFDYWRDRGDFDLILVTDDGHIYLTPDLADSFQLEEAYADDYTVEVHD